MWSFVQDCMILYERCNRFVQLDNWRKTKLSDYFGFSLLSYDTVKEALQAWDSCVSLLSLAVRAYK